jgi:hypothetical protein
MRTHKIKGFKIMKKRRKEIRKDSYLRMRITDRLNEAFNLYSKKHNITKTKVIDDFLVELLKDELIEVDK